MFHGIINNKNPIINLCDYHKMMSERDFFSFPSCQFRGKAL